MATAPVAASPSPSPTHASFAPVVTHKHEPNPHPYAIKTTSTGILSRSNSTAAPTPDVRHSYVPPSPAPSPRRPTHRLSFSEPLIEPPASSARPLPAPPRPLPTPGVPNHEQEWVPAPPPRRTRRAETLPNAPDPPETPPPELPSNPKLWTPSQLAAYLVRALRGRGGSSIALPPPVAQDVATLVRAAKIGGRMFLRLSADDLEEMGFNPLWRAALLESARELRQDVVRGRIWGPGTPSPEEEPEALPAPDPASQQRRLPLPPMISPSPTRLAPRALFDAGSVEDVFGPPSPTKDEKNGEQAGGLRRAPSLARLETRHLRRARSGRVREMAQHLERQHTGSSASESESGSELGEEELLRPPPSPAENRIPRLFGGADGTVRVEPPPERRASPEKMQLRRSESPEKLGSSRAPSTVTAATLHTAPPPPEKFGSLRRAAPRGQPKFGSDRSAKVFSFPDAATEPTVEQLLAAATPAVPDDHWGARAWEALEDQPGATARRVSGDPTTPTTATASIGRNGKGSMSARGWDKSLRGTRGAGKKERRFVSAIFTPDDGREDAPKLGLDAGAARSRHSVPSSVPSELGSGVPSLGRLPSEPGNVPELGRKVSLSDEGYITDAMSRAGASATLVESVSPDDEAALMGSIGSPDGDALVKDLLGRTGKTPAVVQLLIPELAPPEEPQPTLEYLEVHQEEEESVDISIAELPVEEEVQSADDSEDADVETSEHSLAESSSPSPITTEVTVPEPEVSPEPEAKLEPEPEPEPELEAQLVEQDDQFTEELTKLEEQLATSHAELANMRTRLEVVEQNITTLEEREVAREEELVAARVATDQRVAELDARETDLIARTADVASQAAALAAERTALAEERVGLEASIRAEISAEAEHEALLARRAEERAKRDEELTRIARAAAEEEKCTVELPGLGTLPKYMVMVGIGIGVIALQVVAKRFLGRRLR